MPHIIEALAKSKKPLNVKEIAKQSMMKEVDVRGTIRRIMKQHTIIKEVGVRNKEKYYDIFDKVFKAWYEFRCGYILDDRYKCLEYLED